MLSLAARSSARISRTTLNTLQNLSANFARNMSKKAMLILAPGAEEMESIITVDILRRAGVSVVIAGLRDSKPVTCSRDVVIVPDASLIDCKCTDFDAVILPGGLGGSKMLCESPIVGEVLKRQEEHCRLIAAICAGPTALAAHGIGCGRSLTSYPSVKDKLTSMYKYVDDKKVVKDGYLLTSRGPGTAYHYGLLITEALVGPEKAGETAKAMLMKYPLDLDFCM